MTGAASNEIRSKTFPYPVRFAPTTRGRVAYFDEGRGPALLCVHGLVGDFTHFEHVVQPLTDRYRVLGVDLLGCGLSDKPAITHSVRSCAETVLEVMAHAGLDRATLVGHSAGGQIVSEMALIAPRRAERLVLINSAGLRGYPRVLHLARKLIIRPWVLTHTLQRAALPILDQVFFTQNEYTRKFTEESVNRPVHPILEEMAKVMHDLMPDLMTPTVARGASRLSMPVLGIWSDKDRLVPLPTVRHVLATMPNARLDVIADCGHMPTIEKPMEVVSRLERFLAATNDARVAA